MKTNPFAGTIPALMTPCMPDRKPDFDALVRKGKVKRFRNVKGVRNDVKKAIVTLVDGQSIDISTGV